MINPEDVVKCSLLHAFAHKKMYVQAGPRLTHWAENMVQAHGMEDFTHTEYSTHTY